MLFSSDDFELMRAPSIISIETINDSLEDSLCSSEYESDDIYGGVWVISKFWGPKSH